MSTRRKPDSELAPGKTRKRGKWHRALSGIRGAGRFSRRTLLRVGAAILILIVFLIIASFFVDEPMRRQMERRMNASLKGYSVQIPKLHFSLFGGSIALRGLTIRQQANPEPPVMVVPLLKASVQWREILTLHLVADFLMDRPQLHINLRQLQAENRDSVPMKDKGWQDALEQIYPLKINLFRVNDGDVVYIDQDPKHPLHISHLTLRANNIRNIHSREHVYPSPVFAEGVVFESGHAVMDGHADFLAKPFPGIHANYKLDKVPLEALKSMIARANLAIKGGTLASAGEIEYAAKAKNLRVADLTIRGMHLDYIHTPATAKAETARKDKVAAAARKASNRSDMTLKLEKLEIANSNLGLVNKAKDPAYRAYLSDAHLTVTNLSNQFAQGPAVAHLTARFMGSGATKASATFRPEKNGPDFDLNVAIEGTQMTTMNDILRAYGKFDVVAGVFSFYTELKVKNGQIEGYVKPLFKDMDVYDKRQDKDKSLFKKIYEGLVGGVAKLLENRRSEVATKADLSGPVNNPKSSTWEVVVRLIQNAFFRAILPGFDQELFHLGKGPKKGTASKGAKEKGAKDLKPQPAKPAAPPKKAA
ncbi:MAG: DUF748 domain-containing protein [Acidobacteria bacterium]|nr:DUF748 domain-containing protein [Acidobacteriota bacterium]MCA1611796.1 DUF748 domain-containing protein [Acidobacteriota bacterium]MCA1617453.1 DUF748 domain-containing protein [Acidobacteriota bacterium]